MLGSNVEKLPDNPNQMDDVNEGIGRVGISIVAVAGTAQVMKIVKTCCRLINDHVENFIFNMKKTEKLDEFSQRCTGHG